MPNKLEVVSKVINNCSRKNLENIFAPMSELGPDTTKAEVISYCLNRELGAYGFCCTPSNDKTSILINNEGMKTVFNFFKDKPYQPVFTKEQIDRVTTILEVADKNDVNFLWLKEGLEKYYYYFKQYGFNGVNLYNLLTINTANSAAAAISSTGAAAISWASLTAMSWSGSMLLSTLEHHIPNSMVKTKTTISGLKFVVALPIRCVEWTSNQILSFPEYFILGSSLPTNVTEVYKLNIGPKLKNINELKKPVLDWVIKQLKNVNN